MFALQCCISSLLGFTLFGITASASLDSLDRVAWARERETRCTLLKLHVEFFATFLSGIREEDNQLLVDLHVTLLERKQRRFLLI